MDLGSPYAVLHANLPVQSPSHPVIRSSRYQYWYPTYPNVTSGHGVDRACQKPPAPKRCDSPQACCGYTHQHREISSACCLEVLVARQLARSKGTTSIRRTEAAPHSGSSDGEKWPLQHTVESMNDRTVAGGPPRRDRLVLLETGVSEGRAFTAGPESTPLLWCVAHSSSRLDGTKHPGRTGFEVTRRIIGIERQAFRCFSSLEVEGSKLGQTWLGAHQCQCQCRCQRQQPHQKQNPPTVKDSVLLAAKENAKEIKARRSAWPAEHTIVLVQSIGIFGPQIRTGLSPAKQTIGSVK